MEYPLSGDDGKKPVPRGRNRLAGTVRGQVENRTCFRSEEDGLPSRRPRLPEEKPRLGSRPDLPGGSGRDAQDVVRAFAGADGELQAFILKKRGVGKGESGAGPSCVARRAGGVRFGRFDPSPGKSRRDGDGEREGDTPERPAPEATSFRPPPRAGRRRGDGGGNQQA